MSATFLRFTPGQAKTESGLIVFRLALWVGGKEAAHTWAVSGQPGRQRLQRAQDRWPGSMTPIGEGRYYLGDPDATRRVNWASGQQGNYSGTFGTGLGPCWVGIHPHPGNPFGMRSFDLGLHSDENQVVSPGTSGCVGIQEDDVTKWNRLKQVMGWFASYDIPALEVDYGLGTVGKPKA